MTESAEKAEVGGVYVFSKAVSPIGCHVMGDMVRFTAGGNRIGEVRLASPEEAEALGRMIDDVRTARAKQLAREMADAVDALRRKL